MKGFLEKLFCKKEYTSDERSREVSQIVHANKNHIQKNALKFGNQIDRLTEQSVMLSEEFKHSTAYKIARATGAIR